MKKQLFLIPILSTLFGCSHELSLTGDEAQLVERNITQASEVVVFPDDNPSIPDGAVVWKKMNCSQCHGAQGQGVAQKCNLNLSSTQYMRQRKPVEEYQFLAYGKPTTNHPTLKDKLSRRQIWDLVFYCRTLAQAAVSDDELAQIDPVFGSNCAVCHGKRGHGDGPLARNMEPVPANFHQFPRFYDRTDDQLWDHIANGIQWEGMPDFLGKQDRTKNVKFDKQYIYKLVQYVRNFHSSNKPTDLAQENHTNEAQ
ncbi:MAG: c-type cytochrome [Candidatus Melainabacteria bacterium]|nr:c-type cytochrome [Candidatus Melainabacteria bacterium]